MWGCVVVVLVNFCGYFVDRLCWSRKGLFLVVVSRGVGFVGVLKEVGDVNRLGWSVGRGYEDM